jgi:hypothetical protein
VGSTFGAISETEADSTQHFSRSYSQSVLDDRAYFDRETGFEGAIVPLAQKVGASG